MFARTNPTGWVQGDKLTPEQINGIDLSVSRALDGVGGGTYAPLVPLVIQGAGAAIDPLSAWVRKGARLAIDNGAALTTEPEAAVTFRGPVTCRGLVGLEAGATVASGQTLDLGSQSRLRLEAGALLDAKSGSALDLTAGATLVLRAGALATLLGRVEQNAGSVWSAASGSTIALGGTTTIPSSGSVEFQQGSHLTLRDASAVMGPGASLRVQGAPGDLASIEWTTPTSQAAFRDGGTCLFSRGSTLAVNAGAQATVSGSTLTLDKDATMNFVEGASVTGAIASTAQVIQAGATTFLGSGASVAWRVTALDPAKDQTLTSPQAADLYYITNTTGLRTYTFAMPASTHSGIFVRVLRMPGAYRSILQDHHGTFLVTFLETSKRNVSVTLVSVLGEWRLVDYSGLFRTPTDTRNNFLASE